MELFGNEQPDKEPTPEELIRLLDVSFALITKIIQEHSNDLDSRGITLPASTPEADDDGKYGSITVTDLGDKREVKIDETSYDPETEENTTERYTLSFSYDTAQHTLQSTGIQPNIRDDISMSDGDDEDFSRAAEAFEEYLATQVRPATATEIKRLAYVLEIAAYGNVQFNFNHFDMDYENHLDKLYMKQVEADENNENHPE
jgi:hypothetical protein